MRESEQVNFVMCESKATVNRRSEITTRAEHYLAFTNALKIDFSFFYIRLCLSQSSQLSEKASEALRVVLIEWIMFAITCRGLRRSQQKDIRDISS
jgi:hypothetical protein